MQYPNVWNMASGVHLSYLVNLYACRERVYPLINERGVYPQLTLYGFIILNFYLYKAI